MIAVNCTVKSEFVLKNQENMHAFMKDFASSTAPTFVI
jgi:hypothetical protein